MAHDIEPQREKKNYSKKELDMMAKASGIKYHYKYCKYDLAEKLGVKLSRPRPRPKQPNGKACRKARTVETKNPDGETTTFTSINKAAKALGRSPMQLYIMAGNGEIKIN